MPRSNPPNANERLRLAILELRGAETGLNRARAWVRVNNAIADGGAACPRCGGRMSWDGRGALTCGADGTTVAITDQRKRKGD